MTKNPLHLTLTFLLGSLFILAEAAYDLNVARTICAVGKRRGVSARVMLSAFETAIVESGCRNLNYGDRDSVGVFQQRPSQGWGTREQCMNVDYASNKYFEVAQNFEKRSSCGPSAGVLAQCVQRSAYPARYDQNEGNARSLMSQIGCSAGGGGGGGDVRNESPCSSVGHCFDRNTQSCSGTPKDKVNGQWGCPTQASQIICCDTSGGSTKNESPCSDVGHCFNRDREQCNGTPQEKVNGQWGCPTQPSNVICCVRNGGVKNESPCNSVGFCFDRNSGSCPADRQTDKVNGAWACPTQPSNVICCKN